MANIDTISNTKQEAAYLTFHRLEMLTLLNMATPTLSRKKGFVERVKKMVNNDELIQIERECFETSLPATVALPAAVRENSIIMTAAFFLLIKQRNNLKAKDVEYLDVEISRGLKGQVQNMAEIYNLCDYELNTCKCMFGEDPEAHAILFFLLNSIFYDKAVKEHIESLWASYTEFINPLVNEKNKEITDFIRKKDRFIGSYKSLGDYYDEWYHNKEISNPRDTLYTNPVELLMRTSLNGGFNYSIAVPKESLVSKDDSEIAARCAFYAQDDKVVFDAEKFTKEFTQMPEARGDFYKSFIFAIIIRKLSIVHANEVLSILKEKMFGTDKEQKTFDKQLRSLKETNENLVRLYKENAELRAKMSEVDGWKESSRKREYALKERIHQLSKQLEESNRSIDKLRSTIALTNAMKEDSFDDILHETNFKDIQSKTEVSYRNILWDKAKRYRIIIAGGNENLMKRFRTIHSDIILLNDARITNCDAVIRNADILFFKTDCMSHCLYDKCKIAANTCKVPFEYIPETTSINMIEEIICKKIDEKLGTREEVEKYA